MNSDPRLEQFSGCMVGQALGDALGFAVEGHGPEACRQYVEEAVFGDPTRLRGRGPFDFGQYSDDTQLARELMISFAECGGFDPEDYGRRIADIFTSRRIVGRGQSTTTAAMKLAGGVPWDEAGTPPPSAGNGSAMRAAPVGLFFYDDPDRLIRTAVDQGRTTHADPRCSAGAVAIAGATAMALTETKIDPDTLIDRLVGWTRSVDVGFAGEVERLHQYTQLPPEEAAGLIARAGLEEGAQTPWVGIPGFVVPSVVWALYCFLCTPEDYLHVVATAIGAGGDTDTTAAMAGAVAGAHVGLDALPADLTARLNDRGEWGRDALVELAERTQR